jgi:hypothetical protein
VSAPIGRSRAVRYLVLSVGSLAAGIAVYRMFAPPVDIVRVELGGGGHTVAEPQAVRKAVYWDFPFIAGYGLCLVWAGLLARQVFRTGRTRSVALLALPVSAVAVGADIVEDVFLLTGIPSSGPVSPRLLDLARVAAVVKFALLVPAALIALAALFRTAARLRSWPHV